MTVVDAADLETLRQLLASFARAHGIQPSLTLEAWLDSQPQIRDSHAQALKRLHARLAAQALEIVESAHAETGRFSSRLGLRPGEQVAAFELEELLGKGGMGEVWRARSAVDGRRVALKLLAPVHCDPNALERFAREARVGGRLDHPSIVATLSNGEHQGLHWLALEYVPGARTMAGLIAERAIDEDVDLAWYETCARWMRAVADAIEVVHAGGLLHRDLKPANVLITLDGSARVTDFGVVRVRADATVTESGARVGTFAYMSPEQVRGDALDARADVYSLGVCLYELLTLRRPFVDDSIVGLTNKIQVDEPLDVRKLRRGVPRDLAVVVTTAMQKDAKARYASAAALADDLRRYLAGRPIHAKPPSWLARARSWVRRYPTRAAVGAAMFLGGGAVTSLAVALHLSGRELRARERIDLAAVVLNEMRDLEVQARDLLPASPDAVETMEGWLERASRVTAALEPQVLPTGTTHPGLRALSAAVEIDPRSQASIADACEQIQAFADPISGVAGDGVTPEFGWGVRTRLAQARRLRNDFAPGSEYAARHATAARAIRESSKYAKLELPLQVGLVPLGEDPHSGLYEFWHVMTGDEPRRGGDGVLLVEPQTGVVLVLIPGGIGLVGAQRTDPSAPNYDPQAHVDVEPVIPVLQSPYFISKYELTTAQWMRLRRDDPSDERGVSGVALGFGPTSPVTDISQIEALDVLGQVGLTLPTEVQWECAARAGTTTPWWTGIEKSLLQCAENFADLDAQSHRANEFANAEPWRDGWVLVAPVDWFRANPYGLFHVHGNVAEWTRDRGYGRPWALARDWEPRRRFSQSHLAMIRGGHCEETAYYGASATRHAEGAHKRSSDRGCRPSREIDWRR